MAFKQYILNRVHCPRCNAIAQERLEDREQDGYVIIILRCDKCRLTKNLGLTTRKALKLKKRQQRLRESLNRAKSPRTRNRIQQEIALVEQQINKAEVGII